MDICLAIDIGASSGRHIAGWMEDGALRTREVYRFPNGVRDQDGHLVWDTDALLSHVKAGIDEALKAFPRIRSLSVDTWGVDYVLMRGDREVTPCYAYRDSRTQAVIPQVHGKISFSGLYRRTGIQFQPFNTVYQLYADKAAGRLEGVTDFLMIPVSALTIPPVVALVYSWLFTPQSLYIRYSGIIRKSVTPSSLPAALSAYSW